MPDSAQPPPDLATIRRQFEAWNRGDFDGWLGDEAHPDIEYEAGILVGRAEGEQAVFRGRKELRQFFDEWHSQWKMDMTIDELEQVGELASADRPCTADRRAERRDAWNRTSA